jgi:hypothetical protein
MESHKLYDGSIELKFDESKHVYTVNGEIIESATGVTGVINKPALMFWAVNQAIGFLENALKPGIGYDELQIKSMLESAKMAHRKKSTEAADIGTLAHTAIETYIKTGKIVPPVQPQAKICFESFLKWATEKNVKFSDSERKVYSKSHKYAGTMDFACEIDGKSYIGDNKTSTGIYDEYWFQVSAYQQAYEEETGKMFDGQVIVRIGKDGSFEVQYKYNNDYLENVKAFNGALALYKRMQVLKAKSKY